MLDEVDHRSGPSRGVFDRQLVAIGVEEEPQRGEGGTLVALLKRVTLRYAAISLTARTTMSSSP